MAEEQKQWKQPRNNQFLMNFNKEYKRIPVNDSIEIPSIQPEKSNYYEISEDKAETSIASIKNDFNTLTKGNTNVNDFLGDVSQISGIRKIATNENETQMSQQNNYDKNAYLCTTDKTETIRETNVKS